MSFAIKRLSASDVADYRAIRLEALTNHPEAFASTPEQFVQRTPDELRAVLEAMVFLGATRPDGSLAGIMALDFGSGREAHRAWLYQVYVRPDMRGTGCAQALLDAVLDEAQGKVAQVHLGVAAHNEPALRLYQKAGFELYGTDPRSQYVNGRFVDEHLMVRFLDKAPGDLK